MATTHAERQRHLTPEERFDLGSRARVTCPPASHAEYDVAADRKDLVQLLQEHLHEGIGQLIYDRTGRRPMILPVVIEI